VTEIAQAFFDKLTLHNPTVNVYPVRRQQCQQPRYDHLWEGWVQFGPTRVEQAAEHLLGIRAMLFHSWPEPIPRRLPIRPGPRWGDIIVTDIETEWVNVGWYDEYDEKLEEREVARHRRFCGWRELLWPVDTVWREAEVDMPRPTTMSPIDHGLEMTSVEWDPSKGHQLPAGRYTGVAVRNNDGALLWTGDLTSPRDLSDGDSLLLTNMTMTFS
jgi:hypothetical protein